jgi:hypothetical protein
MELLEERQTRGFDSAAVSSGVGKRILFLDAVDRKLIELTVKGTLTRREAGMLVGMPGGTVTRRIRRMLERLNDPLVVALVDYGKLLPELHQEVGLAFFLRKRSFSAIEAEFGLSRYAVKRMIDYVRGWYGAFKGGKDVKSQRSNVKS